MKQVPFQWGEVQDSTLGLVHIYPVGVFSRINRYFMSRWQRSNGIKTRRFTLLDAIGWRNNLRYAKRGDWRSIRQSFNGYLAEPVEWTEGMHRCGRGWTKKRAVRSLRKHARRAGIEC